MTTTGLAKKSLLFSGGEKLGDPIIYKQRKGS